MQSRGLDADVRWLRSTSIDNPPSLPLQAHGNKALAMQGLMLGFVVMMILDVSLG